MGHGAVKRDGYTLREHGLLIGYRWASCYEGDPWDLKPTAHAEISADTRSTIEAQLVESDTLENPTAFWDGFTHGVVAYLTERGSPPTRNDQRRTSESPRRLCVARRAVSLRSPGSESSHSDVSPR